MKFIENLLGWFLSDHQWFRSLCGGVWYHARVGGAYFYVDTWIRERPANHKYLGSERYD